LEDKKMKQFFLAIALMLSVCAPAQIDKALPPRPNPPRLVNDFANLLTPEQEQALEAKLVAYDDSTSNQIAVVIVESLNGYDAYQFATELGEQWGVGGQARFDNGVVVLVSTGGEAGDRDAFIAVGRGLEGAIPDTTAGRILDAHLIANLRTENYYRAFDQTTDALMQAAAGEYTAPEGYRDRGSEGGGRSGKGIIIIIAIIMLILRMFGGGGRGGGFMSRRGYRRFGGGPIIFPGGFGGGGFGGGFGGGGGGGFGGFGGGGFGGGGAGGKW
jgi:uncharacterized protein